MGRNCAMGLLSKDIKTLDDLFVHTLQDIYYAEQQITKALPQMMDAALLAAAQAVEHYEITRYGTLVAWAKQLGRDDCASVLHQILDQEKATDQKLSRIAESKINTKAA